MPCAPNGGGAPVRIVLDSNVVVSALLWRGTPHRLREAIRQHSGTQLFTSAALLDELARVLARPFAAKRLTLIGTNARTLIPDYALAADVVTPRAVPSVIAADPDDDHVIAAAIAAEADLIVSGDRHLLALGTHHGMPIVTPADGLARIGGSGKDLQDFQLSVAKKHAVGEGAAGINGDNEFAFRRKLSQSLSRLHSFDV